MCGRNSRPGCSTAKKPVVCWAIAVLSAVFFLGWLDPGLLIRAPWIALFEGMSAWNVPSNPHFSSGGQIEISSRLARPGTWYRRSSIFLRWSAPPVWPGRRATLQRQRYSAGPGAAGPFPCRAGDFNGKRPHGS